MKRSILKNIFSFTVATRAMPIVPEYMTQRQPLYPLLLLSVYLFSINNWIVILLQNLLSVFNIYYARKIFISIGYKEKYDGWLLLFVVAYPAQFINANTIAPDILLQTFTLLYFGNFVALWQTKQIRYAIWMGFTLIAGFLVKPVLYPFVIVHFFIVIMVAVVQRTKMQRPIIIALMPLVAVLLYNYWNLTRTEKFHFTSNQAFNASYYFYPFISQKEGVDSANRFLQNERREYASIPEYKDRYDYANERGTALLKQNFFPYMAFHLKNTARIFIEPGKGEMDLFTGKLTYGRLYRKEQTGFYVTWKNKGLSGMSDYLQNNPSLFFVVFVFLFNCARVIGFIWFLLNKKTHWLVRAFIFILAGYFAFAAGPIANTRYFLPVSLIVICAGVMGLIEIRNRKVKEIMSLIINADVTKIHAVLHVSLADVLCAVSYLSALSVLRRP